MGFLFQAIRLMSWFSELCLQLVLVMGTYDSITNIRLKVTRFKINKIKMIMLNLILTQKISILIVILTTGQMGFAAQSQSEFWRKSV